MECYICPNLMKKQSHLHPHLYIEIVPFSSAPRMLWWYQGRTSRTCQSCRREPDCWAGRAGGWWRKGDVWRVKEDMFNMKVKWHVAKYGDPYSEFVLCIYPSKCTHSSEHTHTHTHSSEHTPGAVGSHICCGTQRAVGCSVSCSRAPRRAIWRLRERCTLTSPTDNSCRTETRTRNLSIMSLNL